MTGGLVFETVEGAQALAAADEIRRLCHKLFPDFTDAYLLERENLQCVFVLVDSRLEPQKNDLGMIGWLGVEGIPFAIAFTKSDKISQPQVMSSVALYKKVLKKTWAKLPMLFITSAETRKGREELLEYIASINADWGK